jgi:hypothetical protein
MLRRHWFPVGGSRPSSVTNFPRWSCFRRAGILALLGTCAGCGSGGGVVAGPESDVYGSTAPGGQAGIAAGPSKLIFVSSERYSGNLGGLDGADAHCQSLAEAAGRTGVFRGWLSTLNVPAWKRLTHSTVPYALRTGAIVANDWADFTSGTLRHDIDATEGDAPPPNALASCNPFVFWSATDERGAEFGSGDCQGWTDASDAPSGVVLGVLAKDDPVWSTFCYGGSCNSSAPIVCLEQ